MYNSVGEVHCFIIFWSGRMIITYKHHGPVAERKLQIRVVLIIVSVTLALLTSLLFRCNKYKNN